MTYLEREVKLYVPSLQAVRARLEAAGAALHTPRIYERNIRYEDRAGTLTERGIVLRLRQDDAVRLTYKEPVEQSETDMIERFEAEVTVSDLPTMELILGRLGFKPYIVYEKYRTTYALSDAEIMLDEMPYGDFVEIEGAATAIRSVITQLGLEDAPRFNSNYLAIFQHVKKNLSLDFHDLTFDNFAGLDVPLTAFVGRENDDPAI
jgi:adenylate cyclase, class 2